MTLTNLAKREKKVANQYVDNSYKYSQTWKESSQSIRETLVNLARSEKKVANQYADNSHK